ncbi:ankyrin unc44 [Colletotrichum asianum]|uniref:Ankyrin unc44 n=1 Tax=Colletotrichum asianum TaxID=702518 RepID=A0A8H3WJD8_9PEZI|nr:ankyrin unc44 [Colletotrichum asianum]
MEAFAFVASVGSFGELLLKSFSALHRLQTQLSEAPDEIRRISGVMYRLKHVLDEIQALGAPEKELISKKRDTGVTWDDQTAAVKADLENLLHALERLEKEFNKPTKTSKSIRARFKKVFSNQDIENFEKRLLDHQSSFTFMLSVVQERRQRELVSELKSQKHRLPQASPIGSVFLVQDEDLDIGLQGIVAKGIDHLPCIEPEECQARSVVKSTISHRGSILAEPKWDASVVNSESGRVQGWDYNHSLLGKVELLAHELTCCIYSIRIPIGIISARRITSTTISRRGKALREQKSWCLDVFLYPCGFWAKSVSRLYFQKSCSGEFAILEMFAEGRAHPTDILAPSGNSLLHVSIQKRSKKTAILTSNQEIVVRHGMGIDMLGFCRIILGSTKAFDVDFLNQSGKTPLMQCCQFMLESSKSYERMQPMASILIENGADLSICDKVGQSSCLLMFQMPQGFDYFDEVLYKFIDLDMLQNLRPTDLWLVASLARSIPSFKSKLEAEFQGIRTPIGILSSIRPRIEHLPELDPQKQASWVKSASSLDRVTFLRTMCSFGTVDMIEPFLKCGIDVNETEMSDGKTYIRHAARKETWKWLWLLLRQELAWSRRNGYVRAPIYVPRFWRICSSAGLSSLNENLFPASRDLPQNQNFGYCRGF